MVYIKILYLNWCPLRWKSSHFDILLRNDFEFISSTCCLCKIRLSYKRSFKTLNRMFMEETIMTVQNSVLLFYYIIMIFWPFTPTAFRSGKFNSSNMHVKSTPPSNIFILFKRTIVQLYILYTSFSKHL